MKVFIDQMSVEFDVYQVRGDLILRMLTSVAATAAQLLDAVRQNV